jgi:hypothetical protein
MIEYIKHYYKFKNKDYKNYKKQFKRSDIV